MPELENAGIAAIVPPDEDELQDPPGEWTTPEVLAGDVPETLVHSKRTVRVCVAPAWHLAGAFLLGRQ